jgi:tRNA (cmo5U34)-methyltransferase
MCWRRRSFDRDRRPIHELDVGRRPTLIGYEVINIITVGYTSGVSGSPPDVNLWSTPGHALDYLSHADRIPHRTEGEAVVLECLPPRLDRVLDLGTGDGRLLALVKRARPGATAVALDFSPTMLERARRRFANDQTVQVVAHDLGAPLPALGAFGAVVSCFAIHHLPDARKRVLYEEIHGVLMPGGVFCNLEHVASPTASLHRQFLATMDIAPEDEDPSNKLVAVDRQLNWLRAIGFDEVDCYWKWRELALLAGVRRP